MKKGFRHEAVKILQWALLGVALLSFSAIAQPPLCFTHGSQVAGIICDGTTDTTTSINLAITQMSSGGGGVVQVPPGTCMINPTASTIVQGTATLYGGVLLKSNVVLSLGATTVLQAITNSAPSYAVVLVNRATNSSIIGGTIKGDFGTHTGSTGQWGHDVDVEDAANFTISGTTLTQAWGDGMYVSDGGNIATPSTNLNFVNVVSTNNRRNDLSVINLVGGSISGSTFSNQSFSGVAPYSGIDFEPNFTGEVVTGVSLVGNTITNNAGVGMTFSGVSQSVQNNYISGNTFSLNRKGVIIQTNSYNTFTNNSVLNNQVGGVEIDASDYDVLNGNAFQGNPGIDLFVSGSKNIALKNSFNGTNDDIGIEIATYLDGAPTNNEFLASSFSGTFRTSQFVDNGTGTVRNDGY